MNPALNRTRVGALILSSLLSTCTAVCLGVVHLNHDCAVITKEIVVFRPVPPPPELRPGDLIQHKLHAEWAGLVLENQEGPYITIRGNLNGKGNYIWDDTHDCEWVRK